MPEYLNNFLNFRFGYLMYLDNVLNWPKAHAVPTTSLRSSHYLWDRDTDSWWLAIGIFKCKCSSLPPAQKSDKVSYSVIWAQNQCQIFRFIGPRVQSEKVHSHHHTGLSSLIVLATILQDLFQFRARDTIGKNGESEKILWQLAYY